MVCIEKRPYTLYGRLATLHFRYLTCLLDRGHIKTRLLFLCKKIHFYFCHIIYQNCKGGISNEIYMEN